nr:PREDICTED: uncharacterized protein LOC108199898 isoform X1 [Daucus carota subsp. sativus]
MASSSHLKEKSVEEILPHTQLAMFKPHEEGETIQASKVPTEKISTSKGYYKLSANDVKEIEERDEVFIASPGFAKYKNTWIPVSFRLKGWTITTRKRASGRTEMFYKHHIFRRQLRSKKEVYQYIRYGFVSKNSKEPSSSQAPLNIVVSYML